MSKSKYLIIKYHAHQLVICFDALLQHKHMAPRGLQKEDIVAAGLFETNTNKNNEVEAYCFGRSDSLKIGSRKEIDSALVTRMLRRF